MLIKAPSLRRNLVALVLFICVGASTFLYYRPSRWLPNLPHHQPSDPVWPVRAERVRDGFVHAFTSYTKHARGFDELLPVSGTGLNNFCGWGVTLIDSLDTLLLMDLDDLFQESIPIVANTTFISNERAPFFEVVIRYLGGLLGAYALSREPILLSRADDLATALLPVFNTTSGFPMYSVDTITGQAGTGWKYQEWKSLNLQSPLPLLTENGVLAEILSFQMEFKYLAKLTGRAKYYHHAENAMKLVSEASIKDEFGLLPTLWDLEQGTPSNDFYTVGAFADSAYEYMLKQWLLTGRSEPKALALYLRSARNIINNLLFVSPNRGLLYVTDVRNGGHPSNTFEHLSCFLPGLFALGVQALSSSPLHSGPGHFFPFHTDAGSSQLRLSEREKRLHQWAARGLAYTCWLTYADQATGLGPDIVSMYSNSSAGTNERWIDALERWEKEHRSTQHDVPPGLKEVEPERDPDKRDYFTASPSHLLRPEVVESLYILWRTTGDVKWRDRGWFVFEALERSAKTEYGYSNIRNVDTTTPEHDDKMPSYFLAETLKYLYLLFTDADPLPLDDWVFNTEAHPFPVFHWSPWEKNQYVPL